MSLFFDHDLHIHSMLSSCSNDDRQNAKNILNYAVDNNLREICVTDHYWSESVSGASSWYMPQNYSHISKTLPLPQADGIKFHFGCETEMDKAFKLGIDDEDFDKFDFVIIPTTHLHMKGFTISYDDMPIDKRRERYIERLRRLLEMELPFDKIGIAHLTCPLMAPESFKNHIELIEKIDDSIFAELFLKAAQLGVGIELNLGNLDTCKYTPEQFEIITRPYKIAKAQGCKFYCGSDSHHPESFANMKKNGNYISDYLNLTQDDKFNPF